MRTAPDTELTLFGTFLKTLIAALLLFSLGTASSAGMELQSAEDGTQVTLDDLTGQGKWTLVMIWATNCHICHIQKPEISAFHDKHKDLNAHVVGIALDGVDQVEAVNNYIRENEVSFPSYVGNVAIIASHYFGMTEENLRGTPTYLLFNPEGELLGNNPGQLSVEAIESFMARKS